MGSKTAYEYALKMNTTNPVYYNGMYYPIGTMQILAEILEKS